MNADNPQATPEQEELNELVAYLDGELQGDARRKVEQRVGTDSDYRRRLVELEQSWNLLDSLPVASVDEKFTQSTVTLAAVAIEQESKPWWKSRPTLWKYGLAAAIGFFLMTVPLVAKRRAQLNDIPVMNNMELYLHADSLDFLEMLDEEGIFEVVEDEL
jgi:anti-sigma factor RsiW